MNWPLLEIQEICPIQRITLYTPLPPLSQQWKNVLEFFPTVGREPELLWPAQGSLELPSLLG